MAKGGKRKTHWKTVAAIQEVMMEVWARAVEEEMVGSRQILGYI